jgi:hypothetical protein
MSAEELLRSTTVPELRELCGRLERDAASKQKELQTMVGSRYRDFIQSTDAIDFMHEKALATNKSLASFAIDQHELIAKTQALYNVASASQASSAAEEGTPAVISSTTLIDIGSVNNANIWNCLGDCNIYDASMVMNIYRLFSFIC